VKALVTGSSGFVGRHMVGELFDRGWVVDAADLRQHIGPTDALDLFRANTAVYDLVVHCAARSPHRAAIDGEPATHVYNQLLDAAMFEWAIRTRQRRVLYLSSSAAYPVRLQTHEWVEAHGQHRLSESHINLTQWGKTGDWSPDASYGWTKLTGERMAAAAAEAGMAVHVVRPFSGYGEDQSDDFPFGAFVARARRREDPFAIWGDGSQVRDWIHIDDVVAGALAVIDADVRGPVNLCTGVGTSMLELAAQVCCAFGYEPRFERQLGAPSGVAYRVGDPTRFHEIYRPRVDLAEGVRRAAATLNVPSACS
jgi:nucleoside-diphosphate-sugar epimerase